MNEPNQIKSNDVVMSDEPPKLGGAKQISKEDWDQAYELLKNHNKTADNPIADYYIDVTGKYGVYFTLWRYIKGRPYSPFVKNPRYICNLTTEFLSSIKKTLQMPVVTNTSVHAVDDQTRVGLIGKTQAQKSEDFVFTFGQYRGKTYGEVYAENPSYFVWLVKNTHPKYASGKKFEAQKEFVNMYWQDVTTKNRETSTSQHVGQVKDRFTGKLKVYEKAQKNGDFGPYVLYKLTDDKGNKYLATNLETKFQNIEKDSVIDVNAKIKGHKELLGVKFTLLNYVKPNVVSENFTNKEKLKKIIKECLKERWSSIKNEL